jgi:hypothetical protein
MRKLAGLVLLLWSLSSGAVLVHVHHVVHVDDCCCGHGHDHQQEPKPGQEQDEAPCSICLAIQHVPVIALPQQVTDEVRQDVGAWISPYLALVPDDVFFDRPLARGPPRSS